MRLHIRPDIVTIYRTTLYLNLLIFPTQNGKAYVIKKSGQMKTESYGTAFQTIIAVSQAEVEFKLLNIQGLRPNLDENVGLNRSFRNELRRR